MYPPEINSGRMYAGPGAGPMLAAATAWDELALELHSTAAACRAAVAELAGSWSGPSSASMVAAAAPYVAWLSGTAAQADATAAQAKAAAAAYEAAFASTVPPPVIAANRSLLLALVATNFFGQNTPAIAATEAQYAEMWAQDAAAMYGYAGSSAAATTLTPFADPPQTTDPGGSAGQAAAVGQAAGTSAGNAQATTATVPQAFSAVPNALQSAAMAPAAAAAPDPTSVLSTLSDLLTIFPIAAGDVAELAIVAPFTMLNAVDLPFIVVDTATGLHTDDIVSGWKGEVFLPGIGSPYPTDFPAVITNPGALAGAASTLSAGLGRANAVGALSVPAAWTIAAPEVRRASLTLPATGVSATVGETLEAGSGSAFSQMALAGMAAATMGGTGAVRNRGNPPAGICVAAGAATPGKAANSDGKGDASHDKPRTVVTGIAARIRELAKLRDDGSLTDEEYTEQKNLLLGH